LFLALLAIMAQLTVATAVPASSVSLADVTVLCQHDGKSDAPAAPAHHTPDCSVCFFCHNVVGTAGLIATPPLLPIPAIAPVARAVVLPPATAPPAFHRAPSQPRAPPANF
jgi:hypothetical protein